MLFRLIAVHATVKYDHSLQFRHSNLDTYFTLNHQQPSYVGLDKLIKQDISTYLLILFILHYYNISRSDNAPKFSATILYTYFDDDYYDRYIIKI